MLRIASPIPWRKDILLAKIGILSSISAMASARHPINMPLINRKPAEITVPKKNQKVSASG